jgi:hypothetical protein
MSRAQHRPLLRKPVPAIKWPYGQFALNPFERLALPHLHGATSSTSAAAWATWPWKRPGAGCRVTALDGSDRPSPASARQPLSARAWRSKRTKPTCCITPSTGTTTPSSAIGLLMFFPRERRARHAGRHWSPTSETRRHRRAQRAQSKAPPSWACSSRGTSTCSRRGRVAEAFAGWEIVADSFDTFPAPGDTLKCSIPSLPANRRHEDHPHHRLLLRHRPVRRPGLKARGWRVFATARKPDDVARLNARGPGEFPGPGPGRLRHRSAPPSTRPVRRTGGTSTPCSTTVATARLAPSKT